MARAHLARPRSHLSLSLSLSLSSLLTALSCLVLTWPHVSTARLVANVHVVLSQILRILELVMPRVALTWPRVGCLFCPLLLSILLQRIQSWRRPMPGGHDPVLGLLILPFYWFGCGLELASCVNPPSLYLCWFLLLFCSFCTFKLF
ncbi:hypothetical protein Hanom_Chr07g00655271 [Helianthus anomalus]